MNILLKTMSLFQAESVWQSLSNNDEIVNRRIEESYQLNMTIISQSEDNEILTESEENANIVKIKNII